MSFMCMDCLGDHYPACGVRVAPAFFAWLGEQQSTERAAIRQAMDGGDWTAYEQWQKRNGATATQ